MQDVVKGSACDSEKESLSSPQSNSDCSSSIESDSDNKLEEQITSQSDSEEDHLSEVESFAVGEEDIDLGASIHEQFLLTSAAAAVSNSTSPGDLIVGLDNQDSPLHATHFDQETQARLVALLEAAAGGVANHNLLESCSESDFVEVRRLLNEGRSVQEAAEEGDSLLSLACSAGYYDLAQVLLGMRANVEDRGYKGDLMPLMEAASAGHVDIINLLLYHNANINAVSQTGSTSLMYACANGHLEAVKNLLANNASIEVHNENGHTPLMEAASAGHVEVAQVLLDKGAGINTSSNEFKESALTLACYKGHLEMVEFLLDAGADQEHKTDEMHTALMEACMDGHVEVARLLLDHGAQVNMPADSFESPLTLAACGGHTTLTQLLLERGANIEEVNDEGYTPLMEAAREGHHEVVKLLLNVKINDKKPLPPNVPAAKIDVLTEETQETALTLACCGGFKEVAEVLVSQNANMELGASSALMEASQEGHKELVEFLLSSGASVNTQTTTGDTALTYACENGHTSVVDILLKYGADIEHTSEGGRTPLMKAVRANHLCTVQFLLDKKADFRKVTSDGEHTALSLAVVANHMRMVYMLLSVGADPQHTLKDNCTLVMEAAKEGFTEVAKMLIEYPNHSVPNVPLSMDNAPDASSHGPNCSAGPNCPHYNASQSALSIDSDLRPSHIISDKSTSPQQSSALQAKNNNLKKQQPKLTTSGTPDKAFGARSPNPPPPTKGSVQEKATPFNPDNYYYSSLTSTDNLSNKLLQLQQKQNLLEELQRVEMTMDETGESSAGATGSFDVYNQPLHSLHTITNSTSSNTSSPLHSLAQATHTVETQTGATIPHSYMTAFPNAGLPNIASGALLSLSAPTPSAGNSSSMVDPLYSSPHVLPSPSIADSSFLPVSMPPYSSPPPVSSAPPHYTTTTVPVSERKIMVPSKRQAERKKQLAGKLLEQGIDKPKPSSTAYSFTASTLPSAANTYSSTAANGGVKPRPDNKRSVPLDCDCSNPLSQSQSSATADDQLLQQKIQLNQAASIKQQLLHHGAKPNANQGVAEKIAQAFATSGVNPNISTSQAWDLSSLEKSSVNNQRTSSPQNINPYLGTPSVTCNKKKKPQRNVNKIHDREVKLQQQQVAATQQLLQQQAQQGHQMLQQLQQHHLHHNDSNAETLQQQMLQQQMHAAHVLAHHHSLDSNGTPYANPALMNTNSSCAIGSCNMGNTAHHHNLTKGPASPFDPNLFMGTNNAKVMAQDIMGQQVSLDGSLLDGASGITAEELHQLQHQQNLDQPEYMSSESVQRDYNEMQNNSNNYHHRGHQIPYTNSTSPSLPPNDGVVALPSSVPPQTTPQHPPPPPECKSQVDLSITSESNRDTALTLACTGGHYDLAKLLISKGADLEHREKKGFTPLILAASGGHASIAELLLANGANIDAASDRTKDTPLSLACSGGRKEVVEVLLKHQNCNKEHRNVSDYTPLSLAASGGYIEIIKILLQNNAEINSRTGSKLGISPLMLAAMNGHTQAVKLLLDNGSDINAQIETNRNTALTLACFQGRHLVVEILLDRKANVEHRAKTGLTPLMEAASGGFVEVGEVLIAKNADVNAPPVPSSRDTALTIAADKGHLKFVELLLNNGAALEVKNKKGNSAMWLAANGGHLDVVELLHSRGADIDSQDNRNVSCLTAAFKKGHFKVVKFMVKHVTQFPSDQEIERYVTTLTERDMRKKCSACLDLIRAAKEKQAVEANKNASNLLMELEMEKNRELSKKEAASRRKQKKKQRRLEKKQEKQKVQDDDDGEMDGAEDEDDDDEVEEDLCEDIPPPSRHEPSSRNKKKNSTPPPLQQQQQQPPPAAVKKTEGKKTKSKEENEERDSGIDSTSQTSATSETTVKVTSEQTRDSKAKKKKKRNSKETEKPVPVTVETITKNIKNMKVTESSQVKASEGKVLPKIVPQVVAKKETPPAPSQLVKDSSSSSVNAPLQKKRPQQKEESAPPKSGTGIAELDTFNDEVLPDIKTKTLNVTTPAIRTFQDSVASLDTFGDSPPPHTLAPSLPPPLPIPGLMSVSAGLLSNPSIGSPKKQVSPRGQQDGWKEVNRKSKKVSVANSAISRIIGRGGCNINAIREASNAHIEVEKQSKSQGDRMVIIRGSKEATRLALTLINHLVKDPEKDLQELINKYVVPKPRSSAKLSTNTATASATTTLPDPLLANKPAPLVPLAVSAPKAPIGFAKPASSVAPPPPNSWIVPPVVSAPPTTSTASPKRSVDQNTSSRVPANGSMRSPAVRQLFREGNLPDSNGSHLIATAPQEIANQQPHLVPIGTQRNSSDKVSVPQASPLLQAKDGNVFQNILQQPNGNRHEPPQLSPLLTDDKAPQCGLSITPGGGVSMEQSMDSNGSKVDAVSTAPSFYLFDAPSPMSHSFFWRSKEESSQNMLPQASLAPMSSQEMQQQPPVVDASRAPGYRSTVITNSVVSIASSSAPGTPVASQNARMAINVPNRSSAATPPPLPSASQAYCPPSMLSRTPPPILPSLSRMAPTSLSPANPMMGRSFTPPGTGMPLQVPVANRLQVHSNASLAPGGPTSIRTERPVQHLGEMAMLQRHLDQQMQMQQQVQGFSTFSPLNLLNAPQFTTSQTSNAPQAVFANNINASISTTPQIQSNLNPNAPDFASRSNSFVTSAFSNHTPQMSQGAQQFQNNINNNNGVGNPLVNPLFQNYNNLPLDGANLSTLQNNLDSLLKAANHNQLSSLHQSPQTSTPASPTPGMIDERFSKLRPIGTERAQKRGVVHPGTLLQNAQVAPPTAPPPMVGPHHVPPPHGMQQQEIWNSQNNPLFMNASEFDLQQQNQQQQQQQAQQQQNFTNLQAMWQPSQQAWNTEM